MTFLQRIKSIFSLENMLLGMLLLPVVFVNVNPYHDWGGDFAQYIQQAINIVTGKAQNDTFYVFNPHNPYLGPPAYPVGFSLLLAPVYAIFGNSILAFKYAIGLFIWASSFLFYKLIRLYFNGLIAFLATFFFVFNPWVLQFKEEILADFPFLLFVMLALLLYLKKDFAKISILRAIFLGVTISFSMLIKSVGVVVFLAILVDVGYKFLSNNQSIKQNYKAILLRFGVITISIAVFYIFITLLIFPTKQDSYSFFATLFLADELWTTLSHNASYYIDVFQSFFHPTNDDFNFLSQIVKAGLLTFSIIGFFVKSTHKPNILVFYTIIYLGVILVFPNSTQGIRYLLPILPATFYFMLIGFQQLKNVFHSYRIAALLVIALSYQAYAGYKYIGQKPKIIDGPQHPASVALFDFIKTKTEEDAQIVFVKPRVLGLYAQRKSFSNNPKLDLQSAESELQTLGYNYICITTDIENMPLQNYVESHISDLEMVFANEKFSLYKKR